MLTARILESGKPIRVGSSRGGRRHRRSVQGRRDPVVPRGADPGRRQGHRRHRDRHGGPARLRRRGRAPALDAGDEHGRRPRQRPAVRGNEAPPRGGRRSGCRARDSQPHRERPRPPARSRLTDRARRRADAQRVPRGHRVRRPARRGDADDRVPVLQRGRPARAAGADPARRRPHVAHPAGARAAGPQLRRAVRGDRDARHRDPGQVLARRADPCRRRGDRRDQRPELHRGGPVRRRRRAPPLDDRGERRRRDPECPAGSGAAGVGGAVPTPRRGAAADDLHRPAGHDVDVDLHEPGGRGHVRLPGGVVEGRRVLQLGPSSRRPRPHRQRRRHQPRGDDPEGHVRVSDHARRRQHGLGP